MYWLSHRVVLPLILYKYLLKIIHHNENCVSEYLVTQDLLCHQFVHQYRIKKMEQKEIHVDQKNQQFRYFATDSRSSWITFSGSLLFITALPDTIILAPACVCVCVCVCVCLCVCVCVCVCVHVCVWSIIYDKKYHTLLIKFERSLTKFLECFV